MKLRQDQNLAEILVYADRGLGDLSKLENRVNPYQLSTTGL